MIWKYLAIIGTALIAIVSIYQEWIKRHLKKEYEILLVAAVIISAGYSLYNLNETEKTLKADNARTKSDSTRIAGKFTEIINGLKADTAELKKINGSLNQTRETLRKELADKTIDVSKKVLQTGKNLIDSLRELNNQITGGNGYLYVFWNVEGPNQQYVLTFVNDTKYTIPAEQIIVTNFDDLLKCKSEISGGYNKIDKDCWDAIMKPLPDPLNPIPLSVSPGQMFIPNFPLNHISGNHRFEITFYLKNQSYTQQLYYDFEDGKILQTSRLIALDNKSRKLIVKKTIPSSSKLFNSRVNWDKEFPMPAPRMRYKL